RALRTVIGWVPDEFRETMGNSPALGIELPLEPAGETIVRVRHTQLEEIRVGPSERGYTALELSFKPNASFEVYAAVEASNGWEGSVFDPDFWRRIDLERREMSGPTFRPDAVGRLQKVQVQG
ncbi:MAG: hypothetical protein JO359_04380, partial [Candidatus Eremiobacteraeota bacterium]|nr:hypothetical protein [Candidatus Eremiobacteraeota bacterium]